MGQSQKTVERTGAAERSAERNEAHRQKNGQFLAGHSVQHRRDEALLEMRASDHAHTPYTASAALTPSTTSETEKSANTTSNERPRQCSHSRSTERNPIGACNAAASTNVR